MRHVANLVEPMYTRKYEERQRLIDQIWFAAERARESAAGMLVNSNPLMIQCCADGLEQRLRRIEDLIYTIERQHIRKHRSNLMTMEPCVSDAPEDIEPTGEQHAAAIDAAELMMDRDR